MVVVSDFALFVFLIYFFPYLFIVLYYFFISFFSSSSSSSSSSSFFSIQSNVHYDTSNNLGAAYRRMKAEGKNELELGEGEWRVDEEDTEDGEGDYFLLDKSTKIIGQGR